MNNIEEARQMLVNSTIPAERLTVKSLEAILSVLKEHTSAKLDKRFNDRLAARLNEFRKEGESSVYFSVSPSFSGGKHGVLMVRIYGERPGSSFSHCETDESRMCDYDDRAKFITNTEARLAAARATLARSEKLAKDWSAIVEADRKIREQLKALGAMVPEVAVHLECFAGFRAVRNYRE